jgi:hypothetical protein
LPCELKACIHPRGFNRSIRRRLNISNGFISVDEFAALGLSKTLLYAGGYGFALVEHPVFHIKLFADDL